MAKPKLWRVKPEFDGKVTLESEKKQVVLSNKLSQEQLADLAKDPMGAGFMEKITVTELTNGTQGEN